MPEYLVPIAGLTVESEWQVGIARLRPGPDAHSDLRAAIATARNGDRLAQSDLMWRGRTDAAVLQFHATSEADAIRTASELVDLLRVYHHVREWQFLIGQFALDGDFARANLVYGLIDPNTGAGGTGATVRGHHTGWKFTQSVDWNSEDLFRAVADLAGSAPENEGHRRALIGVHYLSQALGESRPAFRMVTLVTALEAMLLPREVGAQTYRLARSISYFGCGAHSDDLCGRTRETCPYLGLDPGLEADRKRLKQLREHGGEPPWRCSEWHRVIDWYTLRSDIVHGATTDVDPKTVENALFWTIRYLTEPVLRWLIEHLDDPTGALDIALEGLPPPPDWEARLGPMPSS